MSDEKKYLLELVSGEIYVLKGVQYKKGIPTPADQDTAEYLTNQYDYKVLEGGREAIAYQKFACDEMSSEAEANKIYQGVLAELKQEEAEKENMRVVNTVKAVSSRSGNRPELPEGVSAVQPAKSSRTYARPKTEEPQDSQG